MVRNIDTEKLKIVADTANLYQVLDYIDKKLKNMGFSSKQVRRVDMAVEEIFCNIANYAYQPKVGEVEVGCNTEPGEVVKAMIIFSDCGKPYNPLEKKEPDTSLSAEEREIGGLGIYMTKKIMDSMEYHYEDGKNVLIITKQMD